MAKVGFILILASALFVSVCRADVRDALRRRPISRNAPRSQRQQLNPTPYPTAGYQPERQFPLQQASNDDDELAQPQVAPNTADTSIEQVASRPDAVYGAPARFRQSLEARPQVPSFQRQQTYAAPPQFIYGAPEVALTDTARLRAAQPARLRAAQPARLSADPEEREEDIDNGAEEVEVESAKDAQPNAVAPPAQATVTYFPAGAFSFVQPNAIKLPAQYQTPVVGVPAQLQTRSAAVPVQLPSAVSAAPAQLQSAPVAVPTQLQSTGVAVPAQLQNAVAAPVVASPAPAAVVPASAAAPVVAAPAAYTQPQVYVQPQAYTQPQVYAPQAYAAAPTASSAFYQPQFAAYTAAPTPYSAYTAAPVPYSAYTAAPAPYSAYTAAPAQFAAAAAW